MQTAIHRIETVSDVGQKDGLVVLEQSHEHMGGHLVQTVASTWAERYSLFGKQCRKGLFQQVGIRIGVEPQCRAIAPVRDAWRRRLWVRAG